MGSFIMHQLNRKRRLASRIPLKSNFRPWQRSDIHQRAQQDLNMPDLDPPSQELSASTMDTCYPCEFCQLFEVPREEMEQQYDRARVAFPIAGGSDPFAATAVPLSPTMMHYIHHCKQIF